ncbi:MAG: aminoacyl-tRNA deacylase [Chloroflexi bacterium]|nr:aminoacyl-tRNA deacylase [Chloroflexota bacterium]
MTEGTKTNAMRLLEAKKVPYKAYYFSPEIHSAEGVAEALNLPPEMVFKTLVVVPANEAVERTYLAIVPARSQLDLKKLAQITREKKLRMATQKQAEELTGLQVGGISALALLNKGFRVYLDVSAQAFAEILVSAGQRGINIQVPVKELVRLTKARLADIASPL